ncbi:aminomethyl-transferring glycine dehydrogenase subunit GcvPA, partial [candidate division WOR-3 bacterium]|nr:aminomethyl-transferring glycine dehydrogenase subunit GcvPA [candidate division WOR-3 bacterium]
MNFISVTPSERKEMLEVIGKGIDELFAAIPDELRERSVLNLPTPLSELEAKEETGKLEKTNKNLKCFAGGGVYDHYIPSVVDHIIRRPEFYTAYTPYQAEVSQGTLQAMFEYQSMICELTNMDVSNASIYDGATALAEGICMAIAISGRGKVILGEGINPRYIEVVNTYLAGRYPIETIPIKGGITDLGGLEIDEETACVVLQHPNYLGNLEWALQSIIEKAHARGALAIMSFDPISLGILKTPGEYGVDIATAEGQSLGLPMSLGGPHLGIFTAKREFIRKMPGRIAGKTVDGKGNTGYVMALQTREQHIRREKATSNICTNQQLCALTAALYLTALGGEVIRDV